MAVKRCESNIDVVKAAEIRIKNVFGNGLPVFFSFSGGKDSLCVAQLVVNLANPVYSHEWLDTSDCCSPRHDDHRWIPQMDSCRTGTVMF